MIDPVPTTVQNPAMRNWFDVIRRALSGVDGYVLTGNGSPQGVRAAHVGTLYLQQDGGANSTLWVKESGNGLPTGWVPK